MREPQITEWRDYVGRSRGLRGSDVDELEAHLREQIDALGDAGLADDEAFLVAVKRMGGGDAPQRGSNARTSALVLAVLAALVIHAPRLFGRGLDDDQLAEVYLRNAFLLVLPFLAGWFALRRPLGRRQVLVTAGLFVVAAAVVNAY